MGTPLWAPWRIAYILGPKPPPDACIFCGLGTAGEHERRERHVVCATQRATVVLNRYPFAAGHLLVVPNAHVPSLEALDLADHDALFRLVRASSARLKEAVNADGLNIGINLGATAGAGVAAHLHVHIVPRWNGDTNFMPVVADTSVVPQALEATRDHLARFFADLEST